MIIKNISLHNFRIYRGDVVLNLNVTDKKNVILIFGENGFGKTTFLHALLWCLYGKMIIDVDDSIKKEINDNGYKEYLDSNLNHSVALEAGSNKEYSVTIEFEGITIPSVLCKSLLIRRTYDYSSKNEIIEVKIDGHENELAKQIGYDLFINDFILNKDIARLFFFDSERVVNIAEGQSINERIRLSNAYNQVLGVKKYEDLRSNLLNLRQKYTKAALSEKELHTLNQLKDTIKELKLKLEAKKSSLSKKTATLALLKEEYNSISIKLLKEGSNVTVDELNRAQKERANCEAYNIQLKKRLNGFLEFAPLAIAGLLLSQTKSVIEHDYKVKLSKDNFNKQNEVVGNIKDSIAIYLDNASSLDASSKKILKDGINGILQQYTGVAINDDTQLNINKEEYDDFMSVYHNLSGTYQVELNNLIDDYKQNKIKIDKLNRRIHQAQVEASDAHIKKLKLISKRLHEEMDTCDQSISVINQEIGSLQSQLEKAEESANKYENKVRALEKDIKKDELAGQLINELETFLKSLKLEKKVSLEKRMKNILNNLMHKQDFINEVRIVDEGNILNVILVDRNGEEIKKSFLSKGEQQLYASALLQALVEESGIEFPVFIDSPLQKFDERHTQTIITDFYPKISKQVVLFPIANKELTATEYEWLKPIVNQQYEIINSINGSVIKEVQKHVLVN